MRKVKPVWILLKQSSVVECCPAINVLYRKMNDDVDFLLSLCVRYICKSISSGDHIMTFTALLLKTQKNIVTAPCDRDTETCILFSIVPHVWCIFMYR